MTEIMRDTPAFGSGVKPGDILLQVGKTKVREPEDVIDASFSLRLGTLFRSLSYGRRKTDV